MARVLHIHPDNPQQRLIHQAATEIKNGALAIIPTDSMYALICLVGDKAAIERIKRIRNLEKQHLFTMLCQDLSELSTYAAINNSSFRLLKAYTPGPYTFVLNATNEVPRILKHPKRKKIGLRVPDNSVTLAILQALNEPLLTCSLTLPPENYPLSDPEEIQEALSRYVDLMVFAGSGGLEPTTVLDLTAGDVTVLREGKGDISGF